MVTRDWLRSVSRPSRRSHRGSRRATAAPIQALEERILLAAPIALDDYFEQNYDSSNPGLNTFNYVVMNNDYDPDNDFIQVEWVSGPSLGELVEFQAGGSFTWIPPAEWVGTATFTYRIYEVGTPKVYGNTAAVTLKLTGALPAKADPGDGAYSDCSCGRTAYQSATNPIRSCTSRSKTGRPPRPIMTRSWRSMATRSLPISASTFSRAWRAKQSARHSSSMPRPTPPAITITR